MAVAQPRQTTLDGTRTLCPEQDQNQAIREWANNNGYEVSERGRIPSSIVEAFHNKR